MWDETERKIAADLLKNPEIMAFLKKVYCPDRSAIRAELEGFVAMPDETYGQLMRSLALAEKHFANRHAEIKRIADREPSTRSPIAPV